MQTHIITTGAILNACLLLQPASVFGSKDVQQKAESTPNVIYILADDLGIGDLGCYGQKIIKTPGIDKLAENILSHNW